jgi:hypothetical protein
VIWCLKGEIAEPEETATASELLGKHVSVAKNTRATEGGRKAAFSMRSAPRLYKEVLSTMVTPIRDLHLAFQIPFVFQTVVESES